MESAIVIAVASRMSRSTTHRKLSTAIMPGPADTSLSAIQITAAAVSAQRSSASRPASRSRSAVSAPHTTINSSAIAPAIRMRSGVSAAASCEGIERSNVI